MGLDKVMGLPEYSLNYLLSDRASSIVFLPNRFTQNSQDIFCGISTDFPEFLRVFTNCLPISLMNCRKVVCGSTLILDFRFPIYPEPQTRIQAWADEFGSGHLQGVFQRTSELREF